MFKPARRRECFYLGCAIWPCAGGCLPLPLSSSVSSANHHDGREQVVFLLDPEGNITAIGPGVRTLCEQSESNLLGCSFKDLFADGLRSDVPDPFEMARTRGRHHFHEWIAKGGTRKFWGEVSLSAMRDSTGRIIAFVAAVYDSAERIRQESGLKESETRYRILAETLQVGIWHIDRNDRTVYMNPAMRAMLELDNTQGIEGASYREFFSPESLQRIEHERLKRLAGLTSSYEVEIVGRCGARRQAILTGSPVLDSQGLVTGRIASFMDITDRLRMEARLHESQKMEAIGRLAGGIAHDFNNLLAAIMGSNELLWMRTGEREPLRRHIDEIRKAGESAAALVQQLLAFSRQQVVRPKLLRLGDTVTGMHEILKRIVGRGVEIEVKFSRQLGWVLADPGQIEQLLMNLVLNAGDALNGQGRLGVATCVTHLPENLVVKPLEVELNGYVELAVSDDGCGIPDIDLPRLFEPFFTTKQGKGTGLGLSTVYSIVTQNRGAIAVESAVGLGTTFRIYLPRVAMPDEGDVEFPGVEATKAESESKRVAGGELAEMIPYQQSSRSGDARSLGLQGRDRHAPDPKASPAGRDGHVMKPGITECQTTSGGPLSRLRTILLVDDEDAVRTLVREILSMAGHEVLEACHPEEALELSQNHPGGIHLLLTDMNMPGMDGTELASAISTARPEIKVLFMSGYSAVPLESSPGEFAERHFIPKPFSTRVLMNKIREMLE